jgi:hypothetical protein
MMAKEKTKAAAEKTPPPPQPEVQPVFEVLAETKDDRTGRRWVNVKVPELGGRMRLRSLIPEQCAAFAEKLGGRPPSRHLQIKLLQSSLCAFDSDQLFLYGDAAYQRYDGLPDGRLVELAEAVVALNRLDQ